MNSVFWVSLEKVGLVLIRFITLLVIARFLTPSELGIYAMTYVIVAISNILVDSGFAGALIKNKKEKKIDFDTVFSFNIFMSVLLFIVLYFLSSHIANFYNESAVAKVVQLFALVIVIKSFFITHVAFLTKNLRFRLQSKVFLIAASISSLCCVYFAKIGAGYYSLVYMQIVEAVLLLLLFSLFSGYKPRLRFSYKAFSRLKAFGFNLMFSSLIFTFYNNFMNILLGKYFDKGVLGNFYQANKINDMYSNTLTLVIDKLVFPFLSKNYGSNTFKAYIHVFSKIVGFTLFLFPLFIWLNAESVVVFLFGAGWSQSAWILKIVILSSFGLIIESYTRSYLKASGNSRIILQLEVFKRIFGICILFYSIKYGLATILWVIVFLSFFNAAINIFFMCKYLEINIYNFLLNISLSLALVLFQIAYGTYFTDYKVSMLLYVIYFIFSLIFSFSLYKETRRIYDKE